MDKMEKDLKKLDEFDTKKWFVENKFTFWESEELKKKYEY